MDSSTREFLLYVVENKTTRTVPCCGCRNATELTTTKPSNPPAGRKPPKHTRASHTKNTTKIGQCRRAPNDRLCRVVVVGMLKTVKSAHKKLFSATSAHKRWTPSKRAGVSRLVPSGAALHECRNSPSQGVSTLPTRQGWG